MFQKIESTAIILQEDVIEQEMAQLSEIKKDNPCKFYIFGLMDCSIQNLSQRAWNLMNRGMQGVALSCDKLHKLQISLTSKKMMQLFRIMEDRDAYLLISLGQSDDYIRELQNVVMECNRLKIVLWDTETSFNS